MISSPCIRCPKKNQPKDICSKDCDLLKAVQDLNVVKNSICAASAIDYTAENRYAISLNLNGTAASM